MRKLAPMFITTSILALAAGNVLANDMGSTDKTGSPTVSNNTHKQPLSYNDKSNTAKGTNAKMEDMGLSTSPDKATKSDTINSDTNAAGTTTTKHHKAKKAKVAHHTKASKETVARDDLATDTATGTRKIVKTPPLSATKGEAADSLTGKSAGR